MGKKVTLLTAGHLSSCPRLIKEANFLSLNGFEVSIVYLESIPRISLLDKHIVFENPNWNFYPIQWGNDIDSLISKVYYRVFPFLNLNNNYIQSTSKVLIDKTLSIKADLYIAHHPSVLIAAALAAEKYNAKYAYDIEDAFAYVDEGSYIDNPNQRVIDAERKYINGAVFTTTASPLYSDIYIQNYKLLKRPVDLMNVFEVNDEQIEYKDRFDLEKVSLYWYSQTVGLNRGLQDLFKAINWLPENTFEIHVRGTCDIEVKNELLKYVEVKSHLNNIFFHTSVSMDELVNRNKEHDIGFALEPSISLNRELCITNKILDYLRSGLMIVATNSKGHKLITDDLGDYAISYTSGNVDELSNALLSYIQNRDRIELAKAKSLKMAIEKYNLKIQFERWIKKINEVLN